MGEPNDIVRTWRNIWLSTLGDFANVDVQRQDWLDLENRNPHWSYIEFMSKYFDNALHGPNYDWAISQGMVTVDEVSAVASLHLLLDRYQSPDGNDNDLARILADPAWQEIVAEAGRARARLLALLSDRAEIETLLK